MAIRLNQEPSSSESAPKSDRSALRVAVLLFLFLNCFYLLTSTGKARSIDEIDPVMQSESLLLRHSTAIPQAVNSGIYFGKFDRHGVPRSAWPFGHAAVVLPWSAVAHFVVERANGIPREASDLVISAITCFSNASFAALTVAAAFLIFLWITTNFREALLGSLLLAFSTPLFVYSGWLFSEPASAGMFVAAAFLLFCSGKQPANSHVLSAALLLAFSIHVRPANMVTVFVFIAAALVQDLQHSGHGATYRTTLILLTVVALSGALYLFRNYLFFGNPFDFGVPATAENGKDLESWHNPFWRGVFGFLFSPGKSAFLFCPPIILGILGLPNLWRRTRALALLAAAAPVANLVLYSFRTQWEGSYCYGPRYLIPSLVLLCIPIAALLSDRPSWLRPVFWSVAFIGFLVQAIGLSTNVMEDMARHHYYDQHWDYQMAYSPITGQLQLIWKYLHEAPTAIGLGWDRWFLLLRAAGVSTSLLAATVALFAAGAVTFGFLTWNSVRTLSAGTDTPKLL